MGPVDPNFKNSGENTWQGRTGYERGREKSEDVSLQRRLIRIGWLSFFKILTDESMYESL